MIQKTWALASLIEQTQGRGRETEKVVMDVLIRACGLDEAISIANCDLQIKNDLKPIYAHSDQYYLSEKKPPARCGIGLMFDLFVIHRSQKEQKHAKIV